MPDTDDPCDDAYFLTDHMRPDLSMSTPGSEIGTFTLATQYSDALLTHILADVMARCDWGSPLDTEP